jgi:hypothetical protein
MTSPPQSATSAAPSQAITVADCFSAPLPPGLRREAETMDWDMFRNTYAPMSGPLRLGQWTCTDDERPAARWGPQPRHYQATLAIGDRISTATAAASGPVGALTEMLHAQGIALEMTSFHQLTADGETATFIRGNSGTRDEWAMGLDEDATQSALRAVIACANRLLSVA